MKRKLLLFFSPKLKEARALAWESYKILWLSRRFVLVDQLMSPFLSLMEMLGQEDTVGAYVHGRLKYSNELMERNIKLAEKAEELRKCC